MKFLAFALLCLVAIWFLRRQGREQEAQKKADLDLWLATALAPRLSRLLDQPESDILPHLLGTANPGTPLQVQIADALDSSEISYHQRSSSEILCSFRSCLHDGSILSSEKLLAWDDLLDHVREAFLRSQASTLSFPHAFPWQAQPPDNGTS